MSIQIKKLHPNAIVPTRGSAAAAGFDAYAVEDCVVPAKGKAIVGTGIAVCMPAQPAMYCRVAPRSGLAAKNSLAVGAGVVDQDYSGEVRVILFNHGDADYTVTAGDRVAQLVFELIYVPPAMEEVKELPTTDRGANGFGSTGM